MFDKSVHAYSHTSLDFSKMCDCQKRSTDLIKASLQMYLWRTDMGEPISGSLMDWILLKYRHSRRLPSRTEREMLSLQRANRTHTNNRNLLVHLKHFFLLSKPIRQWQMGRTWKGGSGGKEAGTGTITGIRRAFVTAFSFCVTSYIR